MSDDFVATRLTSQLLASPPGTTRRDSGGPSACDPGAGPTRVPTQRARPIAGLTAADVDHTLTDRALVVSWLNRGTLHLVHADDYWWLHPLTTPQLHTGNRTRLAQEGVSEGQTDRGVEVITAALTDDGPLTREQLRHPTRHGGRADRGPGPRPPRPRPASGVSSSAGRWSTGTGTFVAVSKWLGTAPALIDRDEALRRLARRYLVGHGPASARDLSKWAGITLGDARRSFGALAEEVEPFGDETMMLVGRDDAAPLPPPTLLGGFDPILCGWSSPRSSSAHTRVS